MSPSLSALGGLLVDGPTGVIVKVTLVLGCTALSAIMLRRASAAVRHLTWLLGLSACAALALFTPAAPTIGLDIPAPARSVEAPALEAIAAPDRSDEVLTNVVVAGEPVEPVAIAVASRTPATPIKALLTSLVAASAPFIGLAVWVIGCAFVVMRCVNGHRRIRQMTNAAKPMMSSDWTTLVEAASVDLGYTGDVELLVSDALSAPATSGFIRPVIILPADCASWDAERRHIVLVHELAHVARLDYVAQLVATIACALFWFHPAVWFAAAQLRAEAEHAADDRVLGSGTHGLTYATHLLELARAGHSASLFPAASVGMIRSSRLEGRFRAMLDSTRSREAVTPRIQAAAATLVLCAMIPAAGLRTVAHAAEISAPTVVQIDEPASEAIATTEASAPARAEVAISSSLVRVTTPSALGTTGMQQSGDSTFEKTIDAATGERLTLDLRTGAAVAIHGWDEPRIRLVGRLAGRDWRDTRVDLSRASGGVRLQTDFSTRRDNQSTSHRFELWVPRYMDVSMSSAGGSVTISDLAGEFSGHTGGGEITIERARGRASLSTGGGSILVTNSELSGTVSTGGGSVEISNVTGGLRGTSGSGEVIVGDGIRANTVTGTNRGIGVGVGNETRIITNDGVTIRPGESGSGFGGRATASTSTTTNITTDGRRTVTTKYPDGATTIGPERVVGVGYGYSISKAGGEIVMDDLPGGGTLHTGGGQIYVRSSGGSVSATTGGGDVELESVAGDAHVSTGAGTVQVTIVNANGTKHSVDVTSGKGRVILYLPANIDARFELETAYTDNFDRRTRIESDFALNQTETNEWDDRFGTPRKFVRATGVLGSGAGLIRVQTVNGDVVVRRR